MATKEEKLLGKRERQMQKAETRLKPYEGEGLYRKTEKIARQAWNPLAKKAAGETQRMMSEFLPRFMELPYQGLAGGTGAESLTPQQKMAVMGQGLGSMVGRLSGQVQLGETLGARAREMSELARQNALVGNQTMAQRYQRAADRYNTAYQANEAAKNRSWQARQDLLNRQWQAEQNALSRAASRAGSGGGGVNLGSLLSQITQSQNDQRAQTYQKAYEMARSEGNARAMAQIANEAKLSGVTLTGGIGGLGELDWSSQIPGMSPERQAAKRT